MNFKASDENKINLNNNINQMIFNKNINNNNFNQSNNINLNNNISQNNNINNNIILNILQNNNFLLNQIINYVQQNKINPMNYNLIQMINNLIKINNNITPNNIYNINLMQQNIMAFLYNLNQICNNNQMSIYLQPIINSLNQINNNINNIMNLLNNNSYQININNNFKNNYDNNNNSYAINKKDIKENKNIIGDNFIFKEFEDYFPLIGLKNVGLSCYMNSILQCLLHIPQLTGFFINNYPEQKDRLKKINIDTETGGRLCEEYQKIIREIENLRGQNNSYINPKDFNMFLSNVNRQFAQKEADEKELLLYLIISMHEELNNFGDQKLKNIPKCNQLIEKESFNFFKAVNNNLNFSIISYLFYGVLKSSILCKGCNQILYNFQYFQFLSFPTFNFKDKTFNIYQGFKEFVMPETISESYCENCKGLRDAKVTTKIYYSPPYLIINIDYGKNKKYKPQKINFGGLIDIKDFADENNNLPSIIYKLIAVCIYIERPGSSRHYITYCQNNANKWYRFNDSSVAETKFEEVNSNFPFILIYKKL